MNPIVYDTKDIYLNNKHKNITKKKINKGGNNNKIDEIDNNDKLLIHKTVNKEISLTIQRKRCEMKMTQKELAQKVGVRVDIIQDYENGKAIFNNNIYNKIKKVLQM